MNVNNVETTTDIGTLDIVINDPKGLPISDLEFQVFSAGQSVFSGKTDANGNGKTIEGLRIGSLFEVHVKTDKGVFKKVALGTVQSEECTACLSSPKSRFEFSSYEKTGKPGKAEEHTKKVIEDSKPKTADPANPVIKKPHAVTNDHDKNGMPVALVTNGAKVLPAKAANVIAALPQVDGKPYGQGLDYKHPNENTEVPAKLVCNEYVYHAYRLAGETIPLSLDDQMAYFIKHKRFTKDRAKGEVGDTAFFKTGNQDHVVIIKDVIKEPDDYKWYLYSGAKRKDKDSGVLISKQKLPLYIGQDGQPASLQKDGKIQKWGERDSVDGFTTFLGHGKAGI